MRVLVREIEYAIVRDDKSAQTLIKYGLPRTKVLSVNDPALNFPAKNLKLNKSSVDEPYMVVSLRRWFFVNSMLPVFVTRRLTSFRIFRKRFDQFLTSLASDLDYFLKHHKDLKVVIVSFYDTEDYPVAKKFADKLENRNRVKVYKKDMNEDEFISLMKNSIFLLGMRLHSLILASIAGKPSVALNYAPKVKEFMWQIGLDNLSVSVEEYNGLKLRRSLSYAISNAESLENKVKRNIKKYQAENKRAFEVLNDKVGAP